MVTVDTPKPNNIDSLSLSTSTITMVVHTVEIYIPIFHGYVLSIWYYTYLQLMSVQT